jgi:hypothetical protein
MSNFHERAITFGAIHFFATIILGFMLLAGAASGLSDAPHGEPVGLGVVVFLVLILQAPVVLAELIAKKMSPSGEVGLELSTLCLLAMFSSLCYGYLIAFLVRKFKNK